MYNKFSSPLFVVFQLTISQLVQSDRNLYLFTGLSLNCHDAIYLLVVTNVFHGELLTLKSIAVKTGGTARSGPTSQGIKVTASCISSYIFESLLCKFVDQNEFFRMELEIQNTIVKVHKTNAKQEMNQAGQLHFFRQIDLCTQHKIENSNIVLP